MARTQLVVSQSPHPFATAGIALPLQGQTLDSANGNYFVSTGKEVLVIYNPSGGSLTFTVSSQPDAERRTANINAASVAGTSFSITQMFPIFGWAIGGYINVDSSSSLLNYAIYQVVLNAWPVI